MKRSNIKKSYLILTGVFFIFGNAIEAEPPLTGKTNKTILTRTVIEKESIDTEVPNVEFDFDKASIRPESYAELNRVAKLMKESKSSIKLAGHADNIGEYVYNWHLSKARAESVKAYLVSKGADNSRIAATEFGDTVPISPNSTEEGRQRNRRVEVDIY